MITVIIGPQVTEIFHKRYTTRSLQTVIQSNFDLTARNVIRSSNSFQRVQHLSTNVNNETKELKTAHGHMMPPPLHLSDVCCKCFPFRVAKKHNERTSK